MGLQKRFWNSPPIDGGAGTQAHKNQPLMSRLGFALAGVTHAVRTQRSLRMQLFALLCLLPVLARLQPAPLWWALVILAASAVLAAELFNTAVERLAGHLHPELHPEIRLVKDCAAGGVLLTWLDALGVAIALLVALISFPVTIAGPSTPAQGCAARSPAADGRLRTKPPERVVIVRDQMRRRSVRIAASWAAIPDQAQSRRTWVALWKTSIIL